MTRSSLRWAIILHLAVTTVLLAGCSADVSDGGADRPYASCAGACDAPGDLPLLAPIHLDNLVECFAVIDASTTDEFFANDQLECTLRAPGVPFTSFSASVQLMSEDRSIFRESTLGFGSVTNRVRVSRADYPYDLKITLRIGQERIETPITLFTYEEFRELEVEPLRVGVPAELWPIKIWPDTAIQEGFGPERFRAISVQAQSEAVFSADARLSAQQSANAAGGSFAIDTLPDVFSFFLPVLPGGEATVSTSIYVRGGERVRVENRVDAPGYWLLGEDGSLRAAQIEDLPYLPGYAGYGASPGVEPDPAAPVDIADDPCSGTCRSDEVCVAGGCLRRTEQRQARCEDRPTASCDASEDGDCADLHACIEGSCTNLVCQTQPYPDCPPPSASCDDDGDCMPGHSCMGNACVNPFCS